MIERGFLQDFLAILKHKLQSTISRFWPMLIVIIRVTVIVGMTEMWKNDSIEWCLFNTFRTSCWRFEPIENIIYSSYQYYTISYINNSIILYNVVRIVFSYYIILKIFFCCASSAVWGCGLRYPWDSCCTQRELIFLRRSNTMSKYYYVEIHYILWNIIVFRI